MKPRRFAPRAVGIILSFSLAMPSSAGASPSLSRRTLRVQGVDAQPTRDTVQAGLEEGPLSPADGLEERETAVTGRDVEEYLRQLIAEGRTNVGITPQMGMRSRVTRKSVTRQDLLDAFFDLVKPKVKDFIEEFIRLNREELDIYQKALDKEGAIYSYGIWSGDRVISNTLLYHSLKILKHPLVNAVEAVVNRWENNMLGAEIRLRWLKKGDRLVIQIFDNGTGIPKVVKPDLGKKKVSTKKGSGRAYFGGRGEGVRIAQSGAKKRGWEFFVADRDDKVQGAVATLTIPIQQPKSKPTAAGLEEKRGSREEYLTYFTPGRIFQTSEHWVHPKDLGLIVKVQTEDGVGFEGFVPQSMASSYRDRLNELEPGKPIEVMVTRSWMEEGKLKLAFRLLDEEMKRRLEILERIGDNPNTAKAPLTPQMLEGYLEYFAPGTVFWVLPFKPNPHGLIVKIKTESERLFQGFIPNNLASSYRDRLGELPINESIKVRVIEREIPLQGGKLHIFFGVLDEEMERRLKVLEGVEKGDRVEAEVERADKNGLYGKYHEADVFVPMPTVFKKGVRRDFDLWENARISGIVTRKETDVGQLRLAFEEILAPPFLTAGLEEVEANWRAYVRAYLTRVDPMVARVGRNQELVDGYRADRAPNLGRDRWELILTLKRAGFATKKSLFDELMRRAQAENLLISKKEKGHISQAIDGAFSAGLEGMRELSEAWVSRAMEGSSRDPALYDQAMQSVLAVANPDVLKGLLDDMRHPDRLYPGGTWRAVDNYKNLILQVQYRHSGQVIFKSPLSRGKSISKQFNGQPLSLGKNLEINLNEMRVPPRALPTETPSVIVEEPEKGPLLLHWPATTKVTIDLNEGKISRRGFFWNQRRKLARLIGAGSIRMLAHAHSDDSILSFGDLTAMHNDRLTVPWLIFRPRSSEGHLFLPRDEAAAKKAIGALYEIEVASPLREHQALPTRYDLWTDEQKLSFLQEYFLIVPVNFKTLSELRGIPLLGAGLEGDLWWMAPEHESRRLALLAMAEALSTLWRWTDRVEHTEGLAFSVLVEKLFVDAEITSKLLHRAELQPKQIYELLGITGQNVVVIIPQKKLLLALGYLLLNYMEIRYREGQSLETEEIRGGFRKYAEGAAHHVDEIYGRWAEIDDNTYRRFIEQAKRIAGIPAAGLEQHQGEVLLHLEPSQERDRNAAIWGFHEGQDLIWVHRGRVRFDSKSIKVDLWFHMPSDVLVRREDLFNLVKKDTDQVGGVTTPEGREKLMSLRTHEGWVWYPLRLQDRVVLFDYSDPDPQRWRVIATVTFSNFTAHPGYPIRLKVNAAPGIRFAGERITLQEIEREFGRKVVPPDPPSRAGLEEIEVKWRAYSRAYLSDTVGDLVAARIGRKQELEDGYRADTAPNLGWDRWQLILTLKKAGFTTKKSLFDELMRRAQAENLLISKKEKGHISQAIDGAFSAGLEEDDGVQPLQATGISKPIEQFLKSSLPLPIGIFDPYDLTTQLMLEAMERLGPLFDKAEILDTGAGSGVLGLAALKLLNASHLVSTEPAGYPLEVVRGYAYAIGLSDRVETQRGSLLEPVLGRQFDVALFNAPDPNKAEAYLLKVGEVLHPEGVALLMWHRQADQTLRAVTHGEELFIQPILQDSDGWRIYAITRNPERLRFVREFIASSQAATRKAAQLAAGLEELEARMPGWLREVMTPEELVESIYRAHDIPPLYEGVAVLTDRGLLGREDADPEEIAGRLVRVKRDLRSITSWSDRFPVRVSVWSQKLEEAYRAHGFRVVRLTRDSHDPMQDPIPPEFLLLAVARAVASGEALFQVNVTLDYLRLRGITYREVRDALADLFA